MDKELKEYLDKNMATKADLEEIRKDIATKRDMQAGFDKLDRKIDKVNKDLLGYLEHIDTSLQEHRLDSEVHKKIVF